MTAQALEQGEALRRCQPPQIDDIAALDQRLIVHVVVMDLHRSAIGLPFDGQKG